MDQKTEFAKEVLSAPPTAQALTEAFCAGLAARRSMLKGGEENGQTQTQEH